VTAVIQGLMATSNSVFHAIGEIFQPIFKLFATILAWTFAIALLTILIMAALTPLTVKSTKSMLAMQRLQPEMKKLQQKYKGPENREQLNQELMKLYKEHGVNPASSCIPMFLQMPFLFILYDIIKGLTNTVTYHGHLYSEPRYIPCPPLHGHTYASAFTKAQTMCHDLVTASPPGAMHSLGINLALKPTSYHSSVAAALPYYGLVLVACALQFVQMYQMNRRNPGATQANPQMRNMQFIMPILFAVIYINIQSAVVIYMIVSTIVRIITQDILFRTGIVQPTAEREISADPKPASGGLGSRLRDALSGAPAASLVEGDGDQGEKKGPSGAGKPSGSGSGGGGPGNGQSPAKKTGTTSRGGANGKSGGTAGSNGSRSKSGSGTRRGAGGGATGSRGDDDESSQKSANPQNRSRSKKSRKAR
jgi:YidC/Oxa1 family membrane protein insertase